jgi:hypothetical protein
VSDFSGAAAFFVQGSWPRATGEDVRGPLLRQACAAGRLRNWLTVEGKFASASVAAGAGDGGTQDWQRRLQTLLVVAADPLLRLSCATGDDIKSTMAGVTLTHNAIGLYAAILV